MLLQARQWLKTLKMFPAKQPGTNRRPPLPQELQQARELSRWLDSAYRIPFINKTIGLDPLLALLPFFIGDIIGLGFSLHILRIAYRLGCPKRLLMSMIRNIAIDFGVGAVPLAGPLLDAYWKANRMNISLLEKAWQKDGHLWVPRTAASGGRVLPDGVIETEAH